ncbi:caspase recruitment domain-containing protein 14 [Spea bombifrons]|uniref:caspase recruitment domain-containing protein 14 n=1 Tax=Spea bombifrons TaxID=233779 RepID=UPI00234B747A|nr:caspase recruitment domain-containing protein 14 [Spea bombifrons]
MSASWNGDPEILDLGEEELWEMIEQHRCVIVKKLSPDRLTPYLRQAKVLDEMDEEEILHSAKFFNRGMRQGRLLDVLRTRGKNGAIAFLDSLLLVNPKMYTFITGKEASMDPNSFSNLIDSSQLHAFLLNSLQEELQKEKQLNGIVVHHLRDLLKKVKRLEAEKESMRSIETENQRLRKEMDEQSQILSKFKDKQYDLSMRYSLALQEKDTLQTRNHELREQLHTLREELNRVRMDLQMAQSWKSQAQCEENLMMLRKENNQLRESLKQMPLDTIKQSDLTLETAQELMTQLICTKEKISSSETLEKLWQKEKEAMLQDKCNIQAENEVLRNKAEVFHNQLSELQKERDQAYRSRDTAQAQINHFLVDMDSLRQQIMELTDFNSDLRLQVRSMEAQLQTHRMTSCPHSPEQKKCTESNQKQRLVRMDAIFPSEDGDRVSNSSFSESLHDLCMQNSQDLGENTHLQEGYLKELSKSSSQDLPDLLQSEKADTDSEFEEDNKGLSMLPTIEMVESGDGSSSLPISMPRRRHAQRMTSRTTIIAFQGDNLLKQISIIGGNRTGIFIHHVTKDSAADEMSLMPGYQITAVDFNVINPTYKVDMAGMTSEDAHSTLNRVNGFCCLSVRCKIDEYRRLLRDLENGSEVSGDSFYVRVNLSMPGRIGGGLQVTCGEILHIKDTMFKNRCQWFAHRVNAYTLKDGESGIIPNYRQAQQQLITCVQHMTWQMTWQSAAWRKCRKQVRVVSTDRCISHLLWASLDCGICEDPSSGSTLGRSCPTLMPYTLVTHVTVTSPRPVLFVPSLLGRILSDKLCTSKDFMKCDTECLTDAQYAARYQRGEIIGEKEGEKVRCCFTRQNVEAVAQQNAHCLLELGLSCVSVLLRAGIYPIILHVPLTEKSTKKLKKLLHWWRNCEDLLLECAHREETELDSLPCLYRTVEPESWSDTESLISSVKEAVTDEQKHVVWLENKQC